MSTSNFPNIAYEKRERPPATDANPTLTSLMSAKSRKDWVDVSIPKHTPYFDSEGRAISHQPIGLNSMLFEAGQTHHVPPEVAQELRTAIANYQESVALQMQKRNKANVPHFTGFEDQEIMEQEQVV